ncbi:hypothetical protein ECANGB1_2621 [Enterospora canceri]|uniref:Uncharacterized protein n=1 Tax=Enterospora canceri TaxID=1081671 RepID=A0A1Y1S9J6_9MICR|nr:hypothetical protein ECANGB1_2621 [Enterospora canceri]
MRANVPELILFNFLLKMRLLQWGRMAVSSWNESAILSKELRVVRVPLKKTLLTSPL